MRYGIEIYQDKNYAEVLELMLQEDDFSLPHYDYLKDLGIMVRDLKTRKLAGFVCAICGQSNTAYIDYLITDRSVREKGLVHNRILLRMFKALMTVLHYKGITAMLGHVPKENKLLKRLYRRKGAEYLGEYSLFRKDITKEDLA